MEKYLTYDEYIELGGTIPEMPFNILEFNAEKQIDKYTYGRLKKLSTQVDEVKRCVFDLIQIQNSYNTNQTNKNVSHETIDGYSVTYAQQNESFVNTQKNEIRMCIEDYLSECRLDDGTPYLYI